MENKSDFARDEIVKSEIERIYYLLAGADVANCAGGGSILKLFGLPGSQLDYSEHVGVVLELIHLLCSC